MTRESRKAIVYLVVLPAVICLASVLNWVRARSGQGIGNNSRACKHPDAEAFLGKQSFDWFPIRFRCEWFAPAPSTPVQETSLAATVVLFVSIVALVVGGIVLWRSRSVATTPTVADSATIAATSRLTVENPNHPEGWDRVLEKLREDGFSADEAVKVTRAVLHVPLARARSLVRQSAVWTEPQDD